MFLQYLINLSVTIFVKCIFQRSLRRKNGSDQNNDSHNTNDSSYHTYGILIASDYKQHWDNSDRNKDQAKIKPQPTNVLVCKIPFVQIPHITL